MIMPRPMPPYLPIYPEADRARIWARYEQDEQVWQRQTGITMMLNLILALIGPISIAAIPVILFVV